MVYTALQHFLPAIRALNTERPLTKQDLLTGSFLMEKKVGLEIYYSPHNEYINKQSKIVIVGITPGWTQMKTAYERLITGMASGESLEVCLIEAKKAAGFAGTMRRNLIDLLDQCDVPLSLGIPNSSYLFEEGRHLLHTTSIIKYPVFLNGKNYTGHQPTIDRSPLLQGYAYREFPKELAQIVSPALVIPLGKTVEQIITVLSEERMLPNHDYLTGFPHPSGANGHRIKQFQREKDQLRGKVKAWFSRIK